jgi:hypothetical protein
LSIHLLNKRRARKTREGSNRGEMKRGLFKKDNQGRERSREKQGSLQIWTRSKTKSLEMVTFCESIIKDES